MIEFVGRVGLWVAAFGFGVAFMSFSMSHGLVPDKIVTTAIILVNAGYAGKSVAEKNYGWATAFCLMFFAVIMFTCFGGR